VVVKMPCFKPDRRACYFRPARISATNKPQFTGALYFNMSGVRQFFEEIKGQVEVVWPLETMDYGQQEFGIRDRDGYVLAFAEKNKEKR
jgi:uncharacterized glyoxalase superfamily protein PhnB